MQTLLTTGDVIDALGGNTEAAIALGVAYNSITNWRMFGHFPPDTYVMIQQELKAIGLVAPDNLWKMRKVTKQHKRSRSSRS